MNTEVQAPSSVFAALADETRWQILVRLGEAPASASALTRTMPVSRQAIMKHLTVLESEGLVTSERRGKEIVYSAIGARLSALARDLDVIGQGWDNRLARLKNEAERPS